MTLPGFEPRIAGEAIPVLRLFYWADARKREGTPFGDAWLAQLLSGYPGGKDSPMFRKEMLIEYQAQGGLPVFPTWRTISQPPYRIVVDPPTEAEIRAMTLYGSYDHGWLHPAAFYIHGLDRAGRRWTLYEAHGSRIPISQMAKIIQGAGGRSMPDPKGRVSHFRPHPWYRDLAWVRADPQMWHADQQQTDAPNKASADLFRQAGVPLIQATKGMDQTIAGWITGDLWADPMDPGWVITTDCPALIACLGSLRYKPISATVAQTTAQPEAFVGKDDDPWDSCKFFHQAFPPAPRTPKPAETAGSFAWWRQQAKRAQRGDAVQSFQRGMVR